EVGVGIEAQPVVIAAAVGLGGLAVDLEAEAFADHRGLALHGRDAWLRSGATVAARAVAACAAAAATALALPGRAATAARVAGRQQRLDATGGRLAVADREDPFLVALLAAGRRRLARRIADLRSLGSL